MNPALAHAASLLARPCRALLAGALLAGAAAAQTGPPPIAELAADTGAGRLQRLIDGARKEGGVTIYSSATVEDLKALTAAYETRYGVKATTWRASSETIVQRALVESRGGRPQADIFDTNGSDLEALHREQLLQAVDSPDYADLLPRAVLPHREWTGTRLQVIAAAYNTNLVPRESLPRTYDDLLAPLWKGRLGIEAEDADWFATVVTSMGEERGLALFRKIVSTNGISVRKGHTLLANLVSAGEVPLSLTAYIYKVAQYREKGAPVDWFVLPRPSPG